jgi:hypothetical protein
VGTWTDSRSRAKISPAEKPSSAILFALALSLGGHAVDWKALGRRATSRLHGVISAESKAGWRITVSRVEQQTGRDRG